MSKFDKIYTKYINEQSYQAMGNVSSGQPNQNIIQGLVGQMSKGIQNRNQQAEKDLHELVHAIQSKDKTSMDNIVKKYAEQALLAQQQQKTTQVTK